MSKRNANGLPSIRQRKDGSWEARITLGYDPGTGKQIQKSIYGKTQAEVRKKSSKALFSIDEGKYLESSKLTISEWLEIWLSEYAQNAVKFTTYESYVQISKTHICPKLGALRLSEISPLAIQSFYNQLSADGLSPKTVKNVHGVLRRALQQAVSNRDLPSNPVDSCVLPKTPKKEMNVLDESDMARFLKEISGNRHETLFILALFSGMRQSEILGLKWDCVDFDDETIIVKQQLSKPKKDGEHILTSVKNNEVRAIAIAPSVFVLLAVHKEKQAEMRLSAEEYWVDDNFVFTNDRGGHLTHSNIYKRFKGILSKIGINDVRFHDLRHSYATAALQSGSNIKALQKNLGHHSAGFTLATYAHVTKKGDRDSAMRMEAFIQDIKSS